MSVTCDEIAQYLNDYCRWRSSRKYQTTTQAKDTTMTKAHKPGSQKPGPDKTKTTGVKKPEAGASPSTGGSSRPKSPKPQSEPSITLQTDTAKSKQSGKS